MASRCLCFPGITTFKDRLQNVFFRKLLSLCNLDLPTSEIMRLWLGKNDTDLRKQSLTALISTQIHIVLQNDGLWSQSMCLILFISMSLASCLLSSRCLSVLLSSRFDHRHIHYHVYNKHRSFGTAYLTPLPHICITVISRRKVFVLFFNTAVIDGEPVSQKSSVTSETVHYLFILTHG